LRVGENHEALSVVAPSGLLSKVSNPESLEGSAFSNIPSPPPGRQNMQRSMVTDLLPNRENSRKECRGSDSGKLGYFLSRGASWRIFRAVRKFRFSLAGTEHLVSSLLWMPLEKKCLMENAQGSRCCSISPTLGAKCLLARRGRRRERRSS